MREYSLFQLLLLLTLFSTITAPITFCHSSCANDHTACGTDISHLGCTSCAPSVYTGPGTPQVGQDCTLLNQTTLIANELWTTQMNLTGYVSSSPVVKTCGIYQLSGQYVSTDYLTRTWVGLGVNHYKLVIRFSIGFIGTFAGNEAYQVTINGGTSSTNHTFQYACTVFANICNAGGTSSDCFYNYEAVASHATDQLTIKFTALTSQTNPLVQFWGVKDLLVVAFTCSPVCMTCTNPTNCVSCPPRSYLIGSSCVKNCPFLSVPSLRTCVTACPTGYFLNSLNSFCEECPNGCMMCSALSTCQAWTPEANPHNTFYDHISLWIVLLAISVSVLGLVIWTHFKKPPLQSIPQSQDPCSKTFHRILNESNETFQNNWTEAGGDIMINKQKLKPGKEIEGIGDIPLQVS